MEEEKTVVLPPMREDDTWEEPEPEASNGSGPGLPQNIVEALREVRERHSVDRYLDVGVPGMGGLVELRLGPMPRAQLARIGQRVAKARTPEKAIEANADILIAACREVHVRATPEAEWVTVPDPESGEPVGIDERLAKAIGLDATRAREVVHALFGYANSPEVAIGAAVDEYNDWAVSASEEVDEAVLGESPAAPR